MDNDTTISLSIKNSVTGTKKLEKYSETLKVVNSLLNGLDTGVMKTLDNSGDGLKQIATSVKDMEKKTSLAFDYTVLRKFGSVLKTVVTTFSSLTQASSSFLEDFNLFQNAYSGAYNDALKFVNKMSEMYGLDEGWLLRTTGLFKQLGNAMGLATEQSDKLAKLMTQMSIDISSLFNVDVDRASSILQSALAGQTKPARSVGADITQATLQTDLSNLGIDRAVTQLSYAEKRLLIAISLTRQLSTATGDWGRTLESPANQLRIMNEQWTRLSRAVGNVFMPILAKVLPYLNAILMVITEIINAIATLFGYKMEDFDYFQSMEEDAIGFGDALDGASESAKKLKQGLRGFDKLNVITTPSDSGSSAGGGVGGIDPKLLEGFDDVFSKYQKRMKDVEAQATKIRDRIMEWLGFTKLTDEETGDVSFKFDHITGGTVLGALGVGGAIFVGLRTIYSVLKKVGLLKFLNVSKLVTGFKTLASFLASNPILLAITALAGAFVYLYKTNDEFRKKVDELVTTIKDTFEPILKEVFGILKEVAKYVIDKGKEIWNDVLKPLARILAEILQPIFGLLIDTLTVLWKTVIDPLVTIIWNFVIKTVLVGLLTAIKNIIDFITELIKGVELLWDIVSPFLEKVHKKIVEKVRPAIEGLGSVVKSIRDAIQSAVDWWNSLIFKEHKLHVSTIGGGLTGYANNIFQANGGIFVNGQWQPIQNYALGGLPPVGQMFVARENGPEMVGQIGSHTAVMNNDQIVASVSAGVYSAVKEANRSTQPMTPTFIIQVGDEQIAKVVLDRFEDMAKSNGKPITIGG